MSTVSTPAEFRLRYTYSPDTAKLQTWLNSKYRAGLKVDGFYGPLTKSAHERQGLATYTAALIAAGIRPPAGLSDIAKNAMEDVSKAFEATQKPAVPTQKPQTLIPTEAKIVPDLPTLPPVPGESQGMNDLLKSPWVWAAIALLFLRK